MLQTQILHFVEKRLRQDRLPISVKLWDGGEVKGTEVPRIAVRIRSPRHLDLLAQPDLGRIAEGYVEENIDLEGDIREVVTLFAQMFKVGKVVRQPAKYSPRNWGRRLHTRASDRKAISSHYDVSNDFYALWLDRRRVYSCGYFRSPDDDIDTAQEQKLAHICRKLDLQAGERFLDIGCGWGGLLFWAVENFGVHGVGITLSRNQFDYVTQEIEARGLQGRCSVRLLDYRDMPEGEQFDKIASVGMFEHVGLAKLPAYFRKIHDLLRPGGLVMNHGITSTTFDGETLEGGGSDFIDRYVFPDGELTHVSKVMEVMGRQGLEVTDVESLRPHYAKTLWHWVSRLEARADEARALVGEKKYRIWRAYMAGFAFAFESNWDSIYQILAGRPLADGTLPRPLTREHMYP